MTKLLARIIGTKRFKRLALWYYRTFGQPQRFDRSSFYTAMIWARAAEFDGPHKNHLTGDSVAAGGEAFFELIEDMRVSAIPGCRTDTLLARLAVNVLIYKPETVVLHIGGNDILAGIDMDLIVSNLASIHKALRDGGVKRIGWLEVLPLGSQFADHNRTAADLCDIVQRQLAFDVLRARHLMRGDDGFILPKYYGDGIHCNELAYNDVFYPIVAKYVRGAP